MAGRSVHRAVALGLGILGLTFADARRVSGQTRLVIDPRTSLAWWEVNPNLSHLWATTCPEDPAWQPGEGRSVGYMVDYLRRSNVTDTHMSDTAKIPVYPRKVVRSLCTPAVSGEVTVADTTTLRGVHGALAVRSEELRTGLDFRDRYARKAIYASDQFPEFRFEIDSLVSVQRGKGDTLRAVAMGTLEIRGVKTAMAIPIKVRHEGGGLRVWAKTHVPAAFLVDKYGVSALALGLSVGLKVWKDLYMGVDVLLRPQGS
jgi:hypothetical protein